MTLFTTIFKKNIITVSRNWNYFLVLVVFPIILILLAGAILNSASVNNIKVGIVNEGETVSLDFSKSVHNIFPHISLRDCLLKMVDGERTMCIRVYTQAKKPQMDVYIDNTQKVVESYAKQFFLETILEKENAGALDNSSGIDDKLAVFSTSFNDAKQELDRSYQELNAQEQTLLQYQSSLRSTLSDLSTSVDASSVNTKTLLEKMNINVSDALLRTQKGKAKILELQNTTAAGGKQLVSLRDAVREKGIVYSVKKAFEDVPEHPVSLAFPLLIALIITFTSVVLSNLFVARQVNQPQYMRSLVAPVNDSSFLFADYAVNIFFVFIQAVFIFLIGMYLFHIDILNSLPQIALVVFLASSVFVFIGMSFGYFFKSENLSMLLSIFVVLLFQIFSDLLAPTALVSPVVGFFVAINPFVILSRLLSQILLLHRTLDVLVPEITKLLLLFLITLGCVYVAKRVSKKRALE